MSKVAIMTDSNSGITQAEAASYGVVVLPMPFYINGEMLYEEIDLTQEQFYQKLTEGGEIKTSMPLVGDVTDKWDELLQTYDEIVYIPMSSGLSSSCETAMMLAQDYDGKVQVEQQPENFCYDAPVGARCEDACGSGEKCSRDQRNLRAREVRIFDLYHG